MQPVLSTREKRAVFIDRDGSTAISGIIDDVLAVCNGSNYLEANGTAYSLFKVTSCACFYREIVPPATNQTMHPEQR